MKFPVREETRWVSVCVERLEEADSCFRRQSHVPAGLPGVRMCAIDVSKVEELLALEWRGGEQTFVLFSSSLPSVASCDSREGLIFHL